MYVPIYLFSNFSAPRNAGAGAGTSGGGAPPKASTVLYGESEELNRVVILTLARAIHIHGYEQQSTGEFIKALKIP